jgi:hypothetical protein
MNRALIALGAALALSMLVNAVALGRIVRGPDPAPARPIARPVQPPPAAGDLSEVLAEFRLLRSDLARRSEPGRPAGSPAFAPPPDLPRAAAADPEVARILADEEKLQGLWKDLVKLSRLGRSLSAAKYRELVTRVTAEFLGADPAAFHETAMAAFQGVERARREMDAAFVSLPEDLEPALRERREEEARERYLAQSRAALAPLDRHLGDLPAHERFRQQKSEWLDYLFEVRDTAVGETASQER